jgi:hypothetical protein
MRNESCRRAAGLCLALLFLVILTASAKNGRDFGGSYSVSNVVEQGDQAVVTMRVQLFNYSGTDLKKAVVTLRPFHAGPVPSSEFKAVNVWPKRGEVRLTQQVVISRRELATWRNGAQPPLFVVYRDASGHRWERYVQLSNRPERPE